MYILIRIKAEVQVKINKISLTIKNQHQGNHYE